MPKKAMTTSEIRRAFYLCFSNVFRNTVETTYRIIRNNMLYKCDNSVLASIVYTYSILYVEYTADDFCLLRKICTFPSIFFFFKNSKLLFVFTEVEYILQLYIYIYLWKITVDNLLKLCSFE